MGHCKCVTLSIINGDTLSDPTTSRLELTKAVYIRKARSFFCIKAAHELNECIDVPNSQQSVVVAVNCSKEYVPSEKCTTENEIRLVNGNSYREGRVEVCVDGRWGTVCGEGWTNEDAGHVCSRLGYSSSNACIVSFGQRSRLQYNCTTNINDYVLVRNSCQHIGVRCSSLRKVINNNQDTIIAGVLAGIIVILLLVLIVSWVTVCVCYQWKMKIQLTVHTPSQPPTQPSHSHTNVIYDYIDKTHAPLPVSCNLTNNEEYDNVVQCVTNDSYSVIPNN